MKNIRIMLVGILGLFVLCSSCNDWLQEENFTRIGSDVIYEDEAGLKVALGGLYNLQRTYERVSDANGTTQNNLWVYCADDLGSTRTFNDAQIYKANMNAINFPRGKWPAGYQLIDRASAVISNARNVSFAVAANKNTLIAEAKVMRAMTYFKLWQLYDNILIDTIPTTAENAFDPTVFEPATKEAVLGLIKFDLDYAIANLPYLAKAGQVNQGLARHLRAQVAAWENDWSTAAAQCEEIITNGGYQLQAIENVFGANVNHKEAIYTTQLDQILGGNDALSGGSNTVIGAVFQCRYYEMPGSHVIEDNIYGGNSFGWTTPNNYLKSLMSWDPVTGLSPDKRFSNYFYPDTIIGNKPGSPYFGKKLPKSSYPDNFRQYHWSVMKYRDFVKAPGTAASFKDIMVVRYAETLLLAAEANWELSGRDNANAKALGYINQVRFRAFGDHAYDLTSIDQNAVLDEHARELAFEGGRWFLLKRMGVLIERVNLYKKFGSAKTNEVGIVMQPHMVRWPISQDQIDLMGGTFPQNPGY
ncbi:MAG TPA: RagB/SusD family nutrient uptake outer membrane protein [Chryseolinea sp.]|nr:RagB/SusD family nutrient uptake outer membrane protein [Chryseolinea sp.]HPM30178.1 RagB/SusD family nutrient uptake outer membrane protein [Chryseolinea sp.]